MKALILFLLAVTVLPLAAQTGEKLVTAARKQIGVTEGYDPAYVVLDFPNGDVPRARGVCTDVVIRAMRDGLAKDLQQLVNQDMRANFSAYPKNWGLSKPDKNIDHRRVPNLPHVMIVSDRKSAAGVPLVIHNIGGGTQEEDCLFSFVLTGQYRLK